MLPDTSFSGPLHRQVYDTLKRLIVSGHWKSGACIPGEWELSSQMGVSVGTVRKALSELARERIVVRERGRGTFICEGAPPDADCGLYLNSGAVLDPEILLASDESGVPAEHFEQKLFGADRRFPRAQLRRLVRLWRGGGEIICVERVIFNTLSFMSFSESDLISSNFASIRAQRLKKSSVKRLVTVRSVEANDPALIYFTHNAPGLACVRRLVIEADGTAAESSDIIFDTQIMGYRVEG